MNVFFTTHYMDEADNYADEIGIINLGKIVKVDSPEKLKSSVGYDYIEIETDPEPNKHALTHLRKMKGVGSVKVEGNKLTISAKDSASLLEPMMESLLKDNVRVKKVSARQPSIDDVFLKYAGTRESMNTSERLVDLKGLRDRIRRGGR
jgi:ABC-2 type transport system ATP-binding protein